MVCSKCIFLSTDISQFILLFAATVDCNSLAKVSFTTTDLAIYHDMQSKQSKTLLKRKTLNSLPDWAIQTRLMNVLIICKLKVNWNYEESGGVGVLRE